MIDVRIVVADFLENDKVWPPGCAPKSFNKALVEVLSRLPEEDYDEISSTIMFVVEPDGFLATNAPFGRFCPPSADGCDLRFDTIVIFHPCFDYSHSALVGLLAHEIAHSFVRGQDYEADENAADQQVCKWGFEEELKALAAEQAKAKAAAEAQAKSNNQR